MWRLLVFFKNFLTIRKILLRMESHTHAVTVLRDGDDKIEAYILSPLTFQQLAMQSDWKFPADMFSEPD